MIDYIVAADQEKMVVAPFIWGSALLVQRCSLFDRFFFGGGKENIAISVSSCCEGFGIHCPFSILASANLRISWRNCSEL